MHASPLTCAPGAVSEDGLSARAHTFTAYMVAFQLRWSLWLPRHLRGHLTRTRTSRFLVFHEITYQGRDFDCPLIRRPCFNIYVWLTRPVADAGTHH